MKVYLSGGSEIAEVDAENPHIMLSYLNTVRKDGKPNRRLKTIIAIRRKELCPKKKPKSKKKGQGSSK